MKEKQILTEVVICDSVTKEPIISTTLHESLSTTFSERDKSYGIGDILKTQYEHDYKIEDIKIHHLSKINPNNVGVKFSNQADEQVKEANPYNFSALVFVSKINKG